MRKLGIWNFQAFMNSKKNSCRGNYMRKYGIQFFYIVKRAIQIWKPFDISDRPAILFCTFDFKAKVLSAISCLLSLLSTKIIAIGKKHCQYFSDQIWSSLIRTSPKLRVYLIFLHCIVRKSDWNLEIIFDICRLQNAIV